MKKLVLKLTSLALLVVVCASLMACSMLDKSESIEFETQPVTTYEITDGFDTALDFSIVYKTGSSSIVLSYSEYADEIKVINFTTQKTGTRTATVSYKGLTATFQYTVVNPAAEAGFASGTGTEEDPYIIKNYAQFMNINKNTSKFNYYKLGANIDLGSFEFKGAHNTSIANSSIITKLNGCFDGNGYSLFNINNSKNFEAVSVFRSTSDYAVIKNVKITSVGSVTVIYSTGYGVTLENVKRYGSYISDASHTNFGALVLYAYGGTSKPLTIKNCDNYVDISGVSPYLSAFIGYVKGQKTTPVVFLENCNNYANIVSAGAGIFLANSSLACGGTGVSIKNCNNYGTVVGINGAGVFGNYADVKLTEKEVADRHMVLEGYNSAATTTVNGKTYIGSVSILNGDDVTVVANEDKSISVTVTDDEVAKVIVVGYYYGKYTGIVSGTLLYGTSEAVTSKDVNTFTTKTLKNLPVVPMANSSYAVTTLSGAWTPVNVDGDLCYVHETAKGVGLSSTAKLSFLVLVYDSNNNLINGKLVTL